MYVFSAEASISEAAARKKSVLFLGQPFSSFGAATSTEKKKKPPPSPESHLNSKDFASAMVVAACWNLQSTRI